MTDYANSRTIKTALNWTYKRVVKGSSPSTEYLTGSTLSDWHVHDFRTRKRVDPINRIYHGNFVREYTDYRIYPSVVATLRRVNRYAVSNPSTVDINVSGVGFGFAPWRCRYLYREEQSKALLINNCIKGAMNQSVDLATAIAEMDKTGSLLAEKASRIGKAVGMIRKGQFTRAARTLKIQKPKGASRSKSFSNNLLEFQYGWMPIVADMSGLLIHMSEGLRDLIITARDRTSSTIPITGGPQQVELYKYAAAQDRLLCSWRYATTWQRMEQVELLFKLKSGFWDQVSRLGFLNPGQITYQSIPGSFLLDWFSNTGDLIAAMNRELTLEFHTGSYTQFHKNEGSIWASSIFWADQNSNYKYSNLTAVVTPGSFMDFKVKREVVTEPEVVVTWVLSAPLSWNKALTALALVRQQL